jgi:hypothetical protein
MPSAVVFSSCAAAPSIQRTRIAITVITSAGMTLDHALKNDFTSQLLLGAGNPY